MHSIDADIAAFKQPGLLRGIAPDMPRRYRVLACVLLVQVLVALCFSPLGIVSFGDDFTSNFHLALVLVPVMAGALLLGFAPGCVLSLGCGLLLAARAAWSPVDFFDQDLINPLLSCVPVTVGGIVASALVIAAVRVQWFKARPAASYALLFVACLALSSAFSFGVRGALPALASLAKGDVAQSVADIAGLLGQPIVGAEALAGALVAWVVCVAIRVVNRRRLAHLNRRPLNLVFGGWLLVAMAMGFLLVTMVFYAVQTNSAYEKAKSDIASEMANLEQQVDAGMRYDPGVLMVSSIDAAISSYFEAVHGDLATEDENFSLIAMGGTVIATNNADYLGAKLAGGVFEDQETADAFIGASEPSLAYDSDAQGYIYILGEKYEGCTLVTSMPLASVFQTRDASVMWAMVLFLALFALVYVAVARLLKTSVGKSLLGINESLARITSGELDQRAPVSSIAEMGDLARGINQTVDALNASKAELQSRIQRELDAARTIQESALPQTFPPFPQVSQFDVYASMNPAREVGGDFYDFFLIEPHKVGFVIADVSGKGIPAALFMMAAKSQLGDYVGSGMELSAAVAAVNRKLCEGNDTCMFVTAFVGVLDYETGQVTCVNAGHNPPLARRGGAWEYVRERGSMALGIFDEGEYPSFTLNLGEGDALLLYTDGVTESMNAAGELFGEPALLASLESAGTCTPKELVDHVNASVAAHAEGAEQSDDITVLALEFRGAEAADVPEGDGAAPRELTVPATDAELYHVNDFIAQDLAALGCPAAAQMQIEIAVEELFVNVCHYAYAGADVASPHAGTARITCARHENPSGITVSITDWGAPFNPLEASDPTLPTSVEDARIGGLGIFMTKQSVDAITYTREADANTTTFTKTW